MIVSNLSKLNLDVDILLVKDSIDLFLLSILFLNLSKFILLSVGYSHSWYTRKTKGQAGPPDARWPLIILGGVYGTERCPPCGIKAERDSSFIIRTALIPATLVGGWNSAGMAGTQPGACQVMRQTKLQTNGWNSASMAGTQPKNRRERRRESEEE